jgi:hypothetical protein
LTIAARLGSRTLASAMVGGASGVARPVAVDDPRSLRAAAQVDDEGNASLAAHRAQEVTLTQWVG